MLYAILAYHVEAEVSSWTPEADAALMSELQVVHDRLEQEGKLGPAARLEGTQKARTLRGPGAGTMRPKREPGGGGTNTPSGPMGGGPGSTPGRGTAKVKLNPNAGATKETFGAPQKPPTNTTCRWR